MKLRDYKALLISDRRAAMLFDLTERHPRGPNAGLRPKDYEHFPNNWDNVGAVLELKEAPAGAEGCRGTGGWDPRAIFELPAGQWALRDALMEIVVEDHVGMGNITTGGETRQLFSRGSQLTRRARRADRRIDDAKYWIKANITQAIYTIRAGYGFPAISVHGESKAGAQGQFELFLETAMKAVPSYRPDRMHLAYDRPATDPTALMTLNDGFVKKMDEGVADRLRKIKEMTQEIADMKAAKEIVYSYSINMAASFGVNDDEDEDE